MANYPVHYAVMPALRFSRLQLLIRVVAFIALGIVGVSFGAVFAFAYLGLAVFAAIRVSGRDPQDYFRTDGPRVIAALHWFAAVSAWVGLIAEQLPGKSPSETVNLAIDETPHPVATPATAMVRLLTGIPSALVLFVLCWIGTFVWFWAALQILVSERIGRRTFHYLEGLQRWSVRLLAYEACLVDDYPPFSFSELSPPPGVPPARTIERNETGSPGGVTA